MKIQMEFSEAEATALLAFASLGVAMASRCLDVKSVSSQDVSMLATNAVGAVTLLGSEGWTAMNDRFIIEIAMAWPHLAPLRRTMSPQVNDNGF